MIVRTSEFEGFVVCKLSGVIRLGESAKFFADTLERYLQESREGVIVDFSEINYIDSTGIGELVGYLEKFKREGKKLILVNPSTRVRKLLEMTRLDEVFPIYENLESFKAAVK